ncbi:hypothetical protein VTO42DRAFT_6654 [Malbranchea cinnamomea]
MSSKYRFRSRILSFTLFTLTVALLYLYFPFDSSIFSNPYSMRVSKEIVVASLKDDDTSWLAEHLPDWKTQIYVADDPDAELTVPENKGHESMVYLTYIIDHYDRLPDYMIFIHGSRYQWHNDDPMYDAVPIIRSLQLPFVTKIGYAPLRCTWLPGCPSEIQPLAPRTKGPEDRDRAEKFYASAFKELLPGKPVPETVGAPCSSQFAVTREQVRLRPKSDYKRMRNWLLKTELSDGVSGRIMEYTWHMIMQKEPVFCPPAGECYCVMFGLCNLNCTVVRCEKRYILPKYAHVPEGWPERGGGEDGWPVPGWHEL